MLSVSKSHSTQRRVLSAAIAALATCMSANAEVTVTKDFTGIWDQPDQESQGFVVQIVNQPDGTRQGVAYWFTYDDSGNAKWFVGQGNVDKNRIDMEVLEVSGPTFLQSSDPTTRTAEIWGTGSLTFNNCNEGTVDMINAVTGTGLAPFRIARLSSVANTSCSGGISDDFRPNAAPVEIEIRLQNTGVDPDASGKAEFETEPGRAEFEVEVEDLDVGDYDLLVDGAAVGTITVSTDDNGTEGEIEFRSPEEMGHPLLTFDPRGTVIEVAQGGTVFLTSDPLPDDEGDDPGIVVQEVEIEVDLVNAGVYPDGSAEAEFEVRQDRREFSVEVEDIPVGSYALRVAGSEVGTIDVVQDDDETEGELEFRDPVTSGELPLDFDPRNSVVEVLEGGTLLFSVEFPGEADSEDDPQSDSDDDSDGDDSGDGTGDGPGDDDGDDSDSDDPSTLSIEVALENSGVNTQASGSAKYEVDSDGAEFEVEVEDLADGDYDLLVDAMLEATITVIEGKGEVEFSESPEGDELLLTFDPRGLRISVEQAGTELLSVTFPE